MATYTLTVTIELQPDQYLVTASATGTTGLPSDIFTYENTGTTTLGDYYGVCSYKDYVRIQTFTGSVIPVFGNKFIKYPTASIKVPLTEDPNSVKAKIVADVTTFKNSFLINHTTTQVFSV
jgi:hypothetical protein